MTKKDLIARVTELGGQVQIEEWEPGIGTILVEAPHRFYWKAEGLHEICWSYNRFHGIPLTSAWRDLWPSIKDGLQLCDVNSCEWCEE